MNKKSQVKDLTSRLGFMRPTFLTLLVLVTSLKANAFWPFSTDKTFEFSEFSYEQCQIFSNQDDENGAVLKCQLGKTGGELDGLEQSVSEIELNLEQEKTLEELKGFVKEQARLGLESIDDQKGCLTYSLNSQNLSNKCQRILQELRLTTQEGLPLLRQKMAFMRPSVEQQRWRGVPQRQLRGPFREDIEHLYSPTEVPPLSDDEKQVLSDVFLQRVESLERSWLTERSDHPCVIQNEERYRLRDSFCEQQMQAVIKDYIDVSLENQQKDYEVEYREILALYPYLAYLSISEAPQEEHLLDRAILQSLNKMHEDIEDDLKSLSFDDLGDVKELFAYPSLIEKFLQKTSPLSLNSCIAVESLHKENGPGNLSGLVKNIGIGLAAIAGGAACLFTGGAVCALGVAALSEGYFLGSSQLNYLESEKLFNAQLVHPEEMEERRGERNTSALLAPLSFVGLHGAQGLTRSRRGIAEARRSRLTENIHVLKKEFLEYSPTSSTQNSVWITAARNQNAKLYFDVENAAIKRLNDQIGDKNLVTAMTNLHKKLLEEELEEILSKYPDLKVERYSDFKSMRFAFSGDVPANLEQELSDAFRRTAQSYDSQMNLILTGSQVRDEIPSHWFNAGLGTSADQAGIAARQARKMSMTRESSVHGVSFEKVRPELKKALAESERRRVNAVNIVRKYGGQAYRLIEDDGPGVFNEHFFEVMRKNSSKEMNTIKEALKRNFNIDFSDKEVRKLKNYFHKVDDFSPGVWVENRTLANLDDAEHGGFSADFKGMGAKNLQQVARDLAENHNDLDQALLAIREGEKKVTELFNQSKEAYRTTVEETLARFNIKADQACSGDDCVSLVQNPLTSEMEKEIVNSFAQADQAANLRLSFIPPNVASSQRTELAVHGELIEKKVRSVMVGFGDEKLSPDVLKKLNFAIKMPSQVRAGDVQLILGKEPNLQLSNDQVEIIQRSFRSAVSQVNKELEKDVGGVFEYSSP